MSDKSLKYRVGELEERVEALRQRVAELEQKEGGKKVPSMKFPEMNSVYAGPAKKMIEDINCYVEKQVKSDMKVLMLLAGFVRTKEQKDEDVHRWSSIHGYDSFDDLADHISSANEEDIVNCCSQFSSKEKLAIIKALVKDTSMSRQQLLEESEVSQGQLNHHIKDLIALQFVERPKQDEYRMTNKGFLCAAMILSSVVSHLNLQEHGD